MPVDLAQLVRPDHTAVLTMEVQRGVVGDQAGLPDLRDAVAAAGLVPTTARLLAAARQAGARVVHCTAAFRPDRAGSGANCVTFALAKRNPGNLIIGSPSAEVVPELVGDGDLYSSRVHGMSPFGGTSLDIELRNMGVTTIVATGVSLNIGVLGMVIEGVNLGYQVVLPADCTVGVPTDYGDAVLRNTMPMLATVTTADDVIGCWS